MLLVFFQGETERHLIFNHVLSLGVVTADALFGKVIVGLAVQCERGSELPEGATAPTKLSTETDSPHVLVEIPKL